MNVVAELRAIVARETASNAPQLGSRLDDAIPALVGPGIGDHLGTGQAADIDKVCAMREGLGDGALALASGVTPENVRAYLPYVDAFLVGTGIEASFGVIDETKLAALLRAMAV